MKKPWIKFALKAFLIAALIFIIYRLMNIRIIKDVVSMIFISFLLSYVLKPIQEFLYKKGINKKASAIILILSIIGIIAGFVIYFVPIVLKEGEHFYESLEDIKNSMSYMYSTIMEKNKFFMYLNGELEYRVRSFTNSLLLKVLDGVVSFGENVLSFAVVPVLSYYFLGEGEFFYNKFMLLIPRTKRTATRNIFNDIDKILSRYVASQFLLSILIGGLTFIVLISLKVDFPIILSVINGIANIIPYFGPIIGAVPPILMALLISPSKALWVTVLLLIIQQIEGNILSPKIIGDSISMHPIIVIILLILGGKIGGFTGMVLAVPLGVVIKIIYEDVNYYLF
ncbi:MULTISPECIES: AI-2E family transporter [Clostridium]|nr:AI-2E family transporter [Clostridium cadaveris]MDU4951990.1 AI-2E family transporter [Clostridium sp.]MDY4947772.1 AI-2E family transporter [Clostridium cadaveris]NME65873.1 AI-2E family transporter [Clostridium cadaveris]NWK11860.1 AI-2E family transporter [Clostridium cadaveris]UFH66332.1 AI-2E family transporter [Clostridium cadaveris]